MSKRSGSVLYLFILVLTICISGWFVQKGKVLDTTNAAPTILSIEVLDSERQQILPDDAGWIVLTSQCYIRVAYEGDISKANFYATPAGAESSPLKTLIGTCEANDDYSSEITLKWEPTTSFLGYISVVIYNGQMSTTSDNFLIKVYYE